MMAENVFAKRYCAGDDVIAQSVWLRDAVNLPAYVAVLRWRSNCTPTSSAGTPHTTKPML
jgi:hypothetical protein